MEQTIPVLHTPVNLLAAGLNSNNLASQAARGHPLDVANDKHSTVYSQDGNTIDYDNVRRLYGSGMAMRLKTEREMAAGCGGR